MAELSRQTFLQMMGAGVVGMALDGTAAARAARAADPRRTKPRTLIRGADILSMDATIGEAFESDVLVEKGKIAAIGKNLSADMAEVVDARGMILMPGMIDAHRHVWQTPIAGAMVKTSKRYRRDYVFWSNRIRMAITPEIMHFLNYYGSLLAINSGVTSVVDNVHMTYTPELGDAAARGSVEAGIGGIFGFQLSGSRAFGLGDTVTRQQIIAEIFASPMEWHFQTAERLRDQYFSDADAPMQFGVHVSNFGGSGKTAQVSEEMKRVRAMKPALILEDVQQVTRPREPGIIFGITDMQAAGLLGPDLLISHGNEISDAELAMMAANGTKIVSSAWGEFPYPSPSIHGRALKAGVDSCVGTDGGFAPLDFFELVRATYLSLFRYPDGAAQANDFESDQVLAFSTTRGAQSIGMGDRLGSVSVGKRADLVLLATDRPGFPILGGLADRVVNYGQLSDIDSVWIAGRLRKTGGQMIGVDWKALDARNRTVQAELARGEATIKMAD